MVPGLGIVKDNYLRLLVEVLNDLDENGLTNLDLLHSFDAAQEKLVAFGFFRDEKELVGLVGTVENFLGITIRTFSQRGDYTTKLRKRINAMLINLTNGSYKPMYTP